MAETSQAAIRRRLEATVHAAGIVSYIMGGFSLVAARSLANDPATTSLSGVRFNFAALLLGPWQEILPSETWAFPLAVSLSVGFMVLGYLGSKRSRGAIIAMTLFYGVDTVLGVVIKNGFGTVIHALNLIILGKILAASESLAKMNRGDVIQARVVGKSDPLTPLMLAVPNWVSLTVGSYVLLAGLFVFRYATQGQPFPLINGLFGAILPSLIIAGLWGGVTLVGYLSGFRPFEYAWSGLNAEQAATLRERVAAIAQSQDFEFLWNHPAKGFIGSRAADPKSTTAGKIALRITFRLTPHEGATNARLNISTHTMLKWDRGEGKECKRLGTEILEGLQKE